MKLKERERAREQGIAESYVGRELEWHVFKRYAFVYVLMDSTGERYVGVSENLLTRFGGILGAANGPAALNDWVLAVTGRGESIRLKIVAAVKDAEAQAVADKLIEKLRKKGAKLLNQR